MRYAQLVINGNQKITQCEIADDFFSRLKGLMFRRSIKDSGVFFPNCSSIHTFFMRFPIDLVRVDAAGNVIDVIARLKAWRIVLPKRGVKHVLELEADSAKSLAILPGGKIACPEVCG